MVELTQKQLDDKLKFIYEYLTAENPATGSAVDANANVTVKNVATLAMELNKDINLQISRYALVKTIKQLFGEDMAKRYLQLLENHIIYTHDETSLMPYCASISMYPFLLDGLTKLGGESRAPKHLNSYCGGFVNLIFAISAQFAGAIGTPEFLLYFNYFAIKEYGEDYLKTNEKEISNFLQHCVYALNQPAVARGYQSVFWNIAIFDENYMKSLFQDFYFPDGTAPNFDKLQDLQVYFMKWFNNERTKALLTFPVVTVNLLTENNEPKDKKFFDFISQEIAEGNSFFTYMSDSVDSLSSCCRLRNSLQDNEFSYTLGAGGISTGSINVITINLNRIQSIEELEDVNQCVHLFQIAYRLLMKTLQAQKALTIYDAGFIDMDKQYLTIGINGMVESAEKRGIEVSPNTEYQKYVNTILSIINKSNKEFSEAWGFKFNTEFVPAENLGVKNANWDKKDGIFSPRDCYNSYFYAVENEKLNVLDRIKMHGKEYTKYLDGGSALHLNLEEFPTQESAKKLIKAICKEGCNYFCINVKSSICNDCGYIDKRTVQKCTKCNSTNIDYATRVIGYLKKINSFSKDRQIEESKRKYQRG